ncbi:sigma-70 family RNA polymerase sigma factor [Cohnella lupini]
MNQEKVPFQRKYGVSTQPNRECAHLIHRRGGSGLNLVSRLREKEESALQELMALYGDELLRTAYLLMRDRQAAEEAVMDTFIRAFGKIDQLKEPDKLRSWLFRIAANRCRMKMRTWSWRNILPYAEVDPSGGKDPSQGPEELLLTEWRNESLSEAIRGLDYIYREVITLYYYADMSVADIADQIRGNENTVKARLARGRNKLRKMLEEGEDNEVGAGVY